MENLPEEQELLKRSAAGDLTAFEPIVIAYQSRAYQYAFSILRNHHDALDLAQQAFARSFRALQKFDLQKPFMPWFLCILRNLCLNHLGKRKRQPDNPGPIDGSDVIQFIPSGGRRPDAEIASKDHVELIRKAMDALPKEQREVLFLRHFEDLTYEEMATVLGVPKGTIMSRLFNGRKKLAQILKNEGLD